MRNPVFMVPHLSQRDAYRTCHIRFVQDADGVAGMLAVWGFQRHQAEVSTSSADDVGGEPWRFVSAGGSCSVELLVHCSVSYLVSMAFQQIRPNRFLVVFQAGSSLRFENRGRGGGVLLRARYFFWGGGGRGWYSLLVLAEEWMSRFLLTFA